MNTLSGLDASFLYLETPEMPMHVGSFCLYELPEGFKGSLHKALKAHIAQRLHLATIFNHKLGFMPLDLGHPMWVEVDDVDLEFHVRQVKRKSLTVRQAEAVCAELHAQLMDRDHPLWEFHVFERIKRPDGSLCAGVYSKVHHAALDGKAGTALTQAIMDMQATPRDVPPATPSPDKSSQHAPNMGQMIGAVFSNSLAQYVSLIKAIPQAARALGSTVVKQSFSGSGASKKPKSPLRLAPMTDFNVAVTRERSFGTVSLPFVDCRAMAKAVGGSFNDIVLWICATALRTYLAQHGGIPKKSLLAAMPISLRAEGNQELNTQASMTVVELGTQFTDPMKRLRAIMASTGKVKTAMVDLKGVLPTDYPSLLAPWIVGGIAKAAFKAYSATGLSHRLPMLANLVISNVPGPQVPLYMAGARMLTNHPMSIVIHGVALNITIQTYAGSVDFGVIADKQALAQVHELTDALTRAFAEGRSLMVEAPAGPRKKRSARQNAVQAASAVTKAT
ncbi:MAG: wax ester/triacylglycerol synthase family O-acyltransferase [Gammaproteobacteria bacterium]|uniref:wax ester/triacylglycerol synthase family O-acyltransferase n=1 Tax=Rhodoferax sp. TaxID=50421 RepID=UPI0017C0E293|nr:wax ester/triacylglycerol synthase family O-acyltransferase [Rhodoferax sp.]MBU3897864.1 wax ester/triacylglycerol synthase family O-acyltransferase [Gammaproteobacteria bacterium]MBA3059257.1 wax ester/triacylglycerol synthase family O-acyltransferase [Rhodoferax sp.]MBU3997309.1 wax ester/triacylglycerol synthase family O-acyltransferase [Gammaproteobacteria bacterium]MBU4017939.1 wax ester/triacylglycerol synthase family O-acyltransferase [Gammaproteobacteria bacterium]MBU4078606.1 wax e